MQSNHWATDGSHFSNEMLQREILCFVQSAVQSVASSLHMHVPEQFKQMQ